MKTLIFIIILQFSCVVLYSQQIKFKSTKYNFGFVHEGDTAKIEYELKNVGQQPLVIQNYEVECGCTVMEKPQRAIEPGETYVLKVTFDTHNKYDRQDRAIKIFSNAKDSPHELRFKGVVLKPKKKS
ncbi:MAG: DUF1573 domain-containing protein [Bacteroidetes bacterium]|nr:DUF1573 domain-containing protein [Bacteroidota bacterium]